MKKLFLGLIFLLTCAGIAFAQPHENTHAKTIAPRILIAYFSLSGNTRLIAQDIQNMVGGELFEIKAVHSYGPDFDSAVEQAREELRTKARPKLTATVKNMQNYDVIFVGFPNWVGTMPMAVFAFLEQYDFSGKTLIPFCTHGTSGVSETITDFKKLNPQADILEYIDFFRNDVKEAEIPLKNWLKKLGYLKQF